MTWLRRRERSGAQQAHSPQLLRGDNRSSNKILFHNCVVDLVVPSYRSLTGRFFREVHSMEARSYAQISNSLNLMIGEKEVPYH